MDKNALRSLRGLVIDMDGVLWKGELPQPGLGAFFARLKQRQVQFILATNNNTQSPQGFSAKAARMGVNVSPSQIITATVAAIHYLKERYPPGTHLYVIGETPMKDMIQQAGFELSERDVVAVVAALDRSLTYEMLKRATLLIRAGAEFIGANPDPYYPTDEGLVPGSGTVIAALEASTGRQPVIIGKPEPWTFQLALEWMKLPARQVASLGDRLDTDILGGQRAGLKSILVLSGVTGRDDLANSTIQPDWIFEDLSELTRYI